MALPASPGCRRALLVAALADENDDAITEADSPIAPDAELQCTRTGQVLGDGRGLGLRSEREARGAARSAYAVQQSKLLGAPTARASGNCWGCRRSNPARQINVVSETAHRGYRLRNLVIESEPGIAIPRSSLSRTRPTRTPRSCSRSVPIALWNWPRTDRRRSSQKRPACRAGRLAGHGPTAPPSTPDRSDTRSDGDAREAFLALYRPPPPGPARLRSALPAKKPPVPERDAWGQDSFDITGIGPAGLAVFMPRPLTTD